MSTSIMCHYFRTWNKQNKLGCFTKYAVHKHKKFPRSIFAKNKQDFIYKTSIQGCLTKTLFTHVLSPWRCSRLIVKMAWERDEDSFMAVEATLRAEFPISRHSTICWAVTTFFSVIPTTCSPIKWHSYSIIKLVTKKSVYRDGNLKIWHIYYIYRKKTEELDNLGQTTKQNTAQPKILKYTIIINLKLVLARMFSPLGCA